MSWSLFIPSSMLSLGAVLLVLAVVLVYLDVPGKGVPWDKVGAVAALIGGFGVGGAGGGMVGDLYSYLSLGAVSGAASVTAQLLGVSVVGAAFMAFALWAYARTRSNGISAPTKFKSLGVVAMLGLVGTLVAMIPNFYSTADQLVGAFASTFAAALA